MGNITSYDRLENETDEELIYIYADGDGLYTASAKTLNADSIEAVDILGRAAD